MRNLIDAGGYMKSAGIYKILTKVLFIALVLLVHISPALLYGAEKGSKAMKNSDAVKKLTPMQYMVTQQ
ncbi:MAG: hypothetical protein R6V76_09140, partial [Desulfobacterales bacterium]